MNQANKDLDVQIINLRLSILKLKILKLRARFHICNKRLENLEQESVELENVERTVTSIKIRQSLRMSIPAVRDGMGSLATFKDRSHSVAPRPRA